MRGSINKISRKRKGHVWRARIDIPTDTPGERKQKTRHFDRKKDAEEWLTKITNDINEGSYIQPSNMPVGDWVSKWLHTYGKVDIRDSTLASYDSYIQNHIKPGIGHIPLNKLTPHLIQEFYNDLELAPASVKYIHSILRKSLEKAVTLEHIRSNPADGSKVSVPKKSKEKSELQYWDKKQTKKFLESAEKHTNPIYGKLFYVAVWTGMRRGKLIGLRWQDVNFVKSELYVRQSITRDVNGEYHVNDPKSNTSKRKIDLDQWTLTKLKRHQHYMEDLQEQLGDAFEHTDLVFTSTVGKRINVSNLRRAFYNVIDHAKVPKIRFHDLRHTHASMLLQDGAHPKVVQERLGHSSIQITMDIYSHLMPTMQADSIHQLASNHHNTPKMQVVKSANN